MAIYVRLLGVIVAGSLGVAGCGRAEKEAAEKAAKEKQQRDATLGDANLLRISIIPWRVQNGNKCPTPVDLGKPKADPWGHPYRITCSTDNNVGNNTVVSFGPDGQEHTADDIVSLSQ